MTVWSGATDEHIFKYLKIDLTNCRVCKKFCDILPELLPVGRTVIVSGIIGNKGAVMSGPV
jgi:hypothetical protein